MFARPLTKRPLQAGLFASLPINQSVNNLVVEPDSWTRERHGDYQNSETYKGRVSALAYAVKLSRKAITSLLPS